MTISKADVPRVAAAGRSAGELFEVHGELMLDLADDWTAGAKAANLDPDSGGNRWAGCGPEGQHACPDCPHPVPSDPTGEAALAERDQFASELRMRLERWHTDSLWLRDAVHVMAPVVPPSTMNTKSDLWCAHHLRIGLCEVRSRGDLCRVCDDFLKLWKVRPPLSLLRDRQAGKRWTKATVEAALEAEGHRLEEVNGVTKTIRANRGRTGRPNQNQKRKAQSA